MPIVLFGQRAGKETRQFRSRRDQNGAELAEIRSSVSGKRDYLKNPVKETANPRLFFWLVFSSSSSSSSSSLFSHAFPFQTYTSGKKLIFPASKERIS